MDLMIIALTLSNKSSVILLRWGVDINKEDIADNFEACVWEPSLVKVRLNY